mmetsp:Transcript_28183/g.70810  ORF Transcript_28183/g.70810 Transcript_28183/m.70810 type:complete len:205 (+) Transcript_28183:713-1327(+)
MRTSSQSSRWALMRCSGTTCTRTTWCGPLWTRSMPTGRRSTRSCVTSSRHTQLWTTAMVQSQSHGTIPCGLYSWAPSTRRYTSRPHQCFSARCQSASCSCRQAGPRRIPRPLVLRPLIPKRASTSRKTSSWRSPGAASSWGSRATTLPTDGTMSTVIVLSRCQTSKPASTSSPMASFGNLFLPAATGRSAIGLRMAGLGAASGT